MDQSGNCESITIGYRKYCSLTFCRHCNVFQLNIGPMSFRLEKEICDMVCEMMCGVHLEQTKEQTKSPSKKYDNPDFAIISKHNRH